MYKVPLESLDFNAVEAFCRTKIRENEILDFKVDFPSNLEKTVSAFANTHGGIVLIGIGETTTGEALLPLSGVPLVSGLRERVIQKCIAAIHPSVLPEVRVVEFRSNPTITAPDRAVVIVRVEESAEAPHAVDNRTAVYVRRDNVSELTKRATMEELEWLRNKRDLSLRSKAESLAIASDRANRYFSRVRHRNQLSTGLPLGKFRFWTIPTYPAVPLISDQHLRAIAIDSVFPLQFPNPFPPGAAVPITRGVFFDTNFDKKFQYSEIHANGLAYHEIGFWWDEQVEAKILSPTVTTRMFMAGLKFGTELYRRMAILGSIDFHFEMNGLDDRLIAEGSFSDGYTSTCPDNIISLEGQESVSTLANDTVGITRDLLRRLYWAFGLDVLPAKLDSVINAVRISLDL